MKPAERIKRLRTLRIVLEILFGISTAAYFIGGCRGTGIGGMAFRLQIRPLLIAETAGVLVVWIALTLILGRVYCSSVCPVGTLLDISSRLGKLLPKMRCRVFRYSSPGAWRYIFLALYLILVAVGITGVAWLLDPWPMVSNCAGVFNVPGSRDLWAVYGIGTGLGLAAGIASLLIIAACGSFFGRDFCNTFCPVGLGLSIVGSQSVFNIVLDPDKCTGCMACEYGCKASCISIADRFVDNTRCVRCFDCTDICPENAIRSKSGYPRAATPLFRRTPSAKT